MIKSILFLITLIGIYYFLFRKFPEKFTNKGHIYFGLFCIIYMIIVYLLNHQKMFVYNVVKNRIEMHLSSKNNCIYTIDKEKIKFSKGETIHTENSHKYTKDKFAKLVKITVTFPFLID